jgi:putative glutamine amidotransferase
VSGPVVAVAPPTRLLPDYEESVRRAGGTPLLVDREGASPGDAIRRVHGLLLTGGGDVHPSLYGAAVHPAFDAAEPGRDEFEIALVRAAFEADLPVLAICRGIQVLNVARGGTLVQDIPTELPGALQHRVPEPRDARAHDVALTSQSLLHRVLGSPRAARVGVNSRHHQAIGALGSGLAVTAVASDGVIEAVEDPSRTFCLGVQWHPENFWRTGEFSALFEGFVRACGR